MHKRSCSPFYTAMINFALVALCASVPITQAATCATAVNAAPCSLGTEMVEFKETRTGGRYFTTACTNEITAVSAAATGNPPVSVFRKTGEVVPVFNTGTAGTVGLSRYQLYIPDGTISHFYTALNNEQAIVQTYFLDTNPAKGCSDSSNTGNWKLPTPLGADGKIDKLTSACPVGSAPIWRMLRISATNPNLANHRFTSKYDLVLSEMQQDPTWTLDGFTGCANDPYAVYTQAWGVAATSANNGQTPLAVGGTITLRAVYQTLDRTKAGGQATLRVLLPSGIEFVAPANSGVPSQPVCASADTAAGKVLTCVLPALNAATAAEAFITLRATAAYVAQTAAARTLKSTVVIADPTLDVALPQFPALCEANGVPHLSCALFALPAAVAVPTQTTLRIDLPTATINATVGSAVSASFDCVNSGPIAATNVTCGAAPSLASPFALACAPAATAASLAPGAKITCTISGTPAAGNVGVAAYEVSANASNATARQASSLTFVVSPPSTTPTISAGAPSAQTVLTGTPIAAMAFTCSNISSVAATTATCAIAGATEIGLSVACNLSSPQTLAAGASIVCTVSGQPTASGTITVNATATGAANKSASTTVTVNAVNSGSIGVVFGAVTLGTPTTNSGGNTVIPISVSTTAVTTNPYVTVYLFPQYLAANGAWVSPQEIPLPGATQVSVGVSTVSADMVLPIGTPSPVSVRLCASALGAQNYYELCRTPNITSEAKSTAFSAAPVIGTLAVSSPFLPSATAGSSYSLSSMTFSISLASGAVTGLTCNAQNLPSGLSAYGCSASQSSLSAGQSASCTCNIGGLVNTGAATSTLTLSASGAGANSGFAYPQIVVNTVVTPPASLNTAMVSISTPLITDTAPASASQWVVTADVSGSGTSGSGAAYIEVADASLTPLVWIGGASIPITVSNSNTTVSQTVTLPSGATSLKFRVCVVAVGNSFPPGYSQTSCAAATSTSSVVAVSPIATKTLGPPPAVVTVTWKTGATQAPSALQVGGDYVWTVAVASKVSTSPFTGPLYLSIAIPANSQFVSATLPNAANAAATCAPASTNALVVQCTVQSGASASLAAEVAFALTIHINAGAGGTAFAHTALAATTTTTGIVCANSGVTGDGCAMSPALIPAFYDLKVQASGSVSTTSLPTAAVPLVLTCSTDTTNPNATAPLPSPIATMCATTVTYDDNTTDIATPQPYSATVAPTAPVKLCTSDSTATDCALKLKAAPRTVKAISMSLSAPPTLDNNAANNSSVVFTAVSTECTDQPVNYRQSLNGATQIMSPNYDVTMSPNQTLAIEIVDGAGILKYPATALTSLELRWGSRDTQGQRDISISKCAGDFSNTSTMMVPYTQANTMAGFVGIYVVGATETVLPTLPDARYFTVRQNSRGRWFINVRHRGCFAPNGTAADNTCTIFYSVGS